MRFKLILLVLALAATSSSAVEECGADGGKECTSHGQSPSSPTMAGKLTIGFIGAGNIGGTLAKLSVTLGHNVILSNSRGPESLKVPPGPLLASPSLDFNHGAQWRSIYRICFVAIWSPDLLSLLHVPRAVALFLITGRPFLSFSWASILSSKVNMMATFFYCI